MSTLAIFVIGIVTTILLGVFVFGTIYEFRKAQLGELDEPHIPLASERKEAR